MIQPEFGLPDGTYDLKIGKSFSKTSKNRQDYHTLRYDFKPKSVSDEQEAYIATGSNGDVHIAFANEAGDNLTMYKGASKSLKDGKECLLIFDADRGEMHLEKVVSNLNVKQTRGTADETENSIRGQIDKARRHRKPAKRQHKSPTPEIKLSPVQSTPIKSTTENPTSHDSIKEQLFAEMSSSDESGSEEGEIVDDTQEVAQNSKKSTPTGKSPTKKYSFDLESSSSGSSSSSEDEFAAALEKRLNASSSPEPTPTNDEDMPDLLNQKTPPTNEKAPSSLFTSHKLQPLLANDLDLSDTSEDDD